MSEIIPIADQIACLERELHIRERIYPRWVDKGKLTQKAAALELDRMRAAIRTLQRSMTDGKPAEGVMSSGQVAALINQLDSCDTVIQGIMRQAQDRQRVMQQYSGQAA